MDSRTRSFLKTSWRTFHRGGFTSSDVQCIVAGLGAGVTAPQSCEVWPLYRRPPPPPPLRLPLPRASCRVHSACSPPRASVLAVSWTQNYPRDYMRWVVPVTQLQCHRLGNAFLAVSVSSGCHYTDRGLQQQKVLS